MKILLQEKFLFLITLTAVSLTAANICNDENCQTCYDQSLCQQCKPGHLVTDKGKCVEQLCSGIFCLECEKPLKDGSLNQFQEKCLKCEYPYFTLEGVCELSCPHLYKEEYPRKCVPKMSRDVEEQKDIWEIMMWILIFLVCTLCLFCGMFAYQFYLEKDEDDLYGSENYTSTQYSKEALKAQQKQQQNTLQQQKQRPQFHQPKEKPLKKKYKRKTLQMEPQILKQASDEEYLEEESIEKGEQQEEQVVGISDDDMLDDNNYEMQELSLFQN